MRLRTDESWASMDISSLTRLYFKYTSSKEQACRETMLQVCKKKERTRELQVWYDGSQIIGHSYMLYMVNVIYDEAVFITDAEWQGNVGVDVQATIETPHVYIIGRCRGNGENLAYSSTRMECLDRLKLPLTVKGIPITDIMRKCIGDAPVQAEETGQQKGGHYFCCSCPIHATSVCHWFIQLPLISMDERIERILGGYWSKSRSEKKCLYPLKELTKNQLQVEMQARGDTKMYSNVEEMREEFTHMMAGIQRVPAIIFENPSKTLQELGLPSYEVMSVEPMHDCATHIKNLYDALPCYSNEEAEMRQLIKVAKGNKTTPRCKDINKMTECFLTP